jgi:quercetin dioxygenase-like cupin family protein
MELQETEKQRLNEAMVNESWLFMEDAMPVDFGWDLPVYYLQYCADNEIGSPNGIMSYQLQGAENIKDINGVIEELNKHLRHKVNGADILLSFAKRSVSQPLDTEPHNVLLWQVLGVAELTVFIDGNKITRELNQGDMVYLPWNQEHEVTPVTARATVSFGLETPKEIIDGA